MILTDGYPDAAESAVEQAELARGEGIEIVAIGIGRRRPRLPPPAGQHRGRLDLRPQGELVQTFGHIARVIAEGGRALRKLT